MTEPSTAVGAATPAWLADVLACPRCHRRVTEAGGQWRCDQCGVVAVRTLDVPDFLVGAKSLPGPGDDVMDLGADAATAAQLVSADLDFAMLTRLAAQLQADAVGRRTWSPRRRRACDRFHDTLYDLNFEAAEFGGDALLAKIDSKIAELRWPPLGDGLALEAGGGAGFYLPAFSRRFSAVAFVDASLVNLVLAARLCAEKEMGNVAFVRADVTALPFLGGCFELVHENGVIEHVDAPERMLAEGARVRSESGYYVCVSPNRFPLVREPHFGLPMYGMIPAPVRRVLVPALRGFDDGMGTNLLSLGQLRRHLAGSLRDDDVAVFFLPRRVPFTARQTPVRRAVSTLLASPVVGYALEKLLNGVLLGCAPQHIAVARRRRTLARATGGGRVG